MPSVLPTPFCHPQLPHLSILAACTLRAAQGIQQGVLARPLVPLTAAAATQASCCYSRSPGRCCRCSVLS